METDVICIQAKHPTHAQKKDYKWRYAPRIYVQNNERESSRSHNTFSETEIISLRSLMWGGGGRVFLESEFGQIQQVIAIKTPVPMNIIKYYFKLRPTLNGIFISENVQTYYKNNEKFIHFILNMLNMTWNKVSSSLLHFLLPEHGFSRTKYIRQHPHLLPSVSQNKIKFSLEKF